MLLMEGILRVLILVGSGDVKLIQFVSWGLLLKTMLSFVKFLE